jgi:hypothetical protein
MLRSVRSPHVRTLCEHEEVPVAPAVTPPPGRLVRLGVVLAEEPGPARRLAQLCDLAGIDVVWVTDEVTAADVAGVVSRAVVEVLPASDEPWARTVPVSIGRTWAEAAARAEADATFRGYGRPAEVGLFGRLEECQAQVVALAHEGVTDLRCVLPDAPDVHDVVAQLTAVAVGSLATHRPDAPRSPDPPAPPWAPPR